RSEGELVHGGGAGRRPLDRGALAEELVRETVRQRGERGSRVPLEYMERILRERASHADIQAAFDPILDAAGTTSFEAQMRTLEQRAPSLLRAVETHWIRDPAASGVDVIGPDAGRYRDFAWHAADYPGGPRGPNEGRARRMERDLAEVVP